jgi:hypothetical protein
MLYRQGMAKYSADQKTTVLSGRVLRNPMTIGFVGSFFMTDDKGQKFFVAPARALSREIVKHMVQGDKVEIATISNVKPEVMLYAHEVRFRNYDLTTTPPMS